MFTSSVLKRRKYKERINSASSGRKDELQDLPETAQILDAILKNKDTLICLIRLFGGQTVYVPSRWPPYGKHIDYKGHGLRKVLSPGQMVKVVGHYGGTELYIPKCTKYLLSIRDSSIISAYCKATRQGTSSKDVVQKLARKHQLSDRRIWNILKTSEQE